MINKIACVLRQRKDLKFSQKTMFKTTLINVQTYIHTSLNVEIRSAYIDTWQSNY